MTLTTARAALGAADWSDTLEVNGIGAYVVNPQMLAGSKVSDRVATLSVDATADAKTERGELSLVPRFSVIRYDSEHALDVETGSVDFNSLWKRERSQLTVTAQALSDSTVTSELGQTGLTGLNRRHDVDSVSMGLQLFATERLTWQVGGSWQLTRYSDASLFGLTNYSYGSVQFGPAWNFSSELQASLSLGADRLSPKAGTAEDDYSISLQLKHVLSESLQWHCSLGTTKVVFSGFGSQPSTVLDAGISRRDERNQWDLSVRRSVTPIGIGLLARRADASLAFARALSERDSLNASLGFIRSDPVVAFQRNVYDGATWVQANAEWQHHFSPQLSVSAAYYRSRARGASGTEWADGNQARVSLLWRGGRT